MRLQLPALRSCWSPSTEFNAFTICIVPGGRGVRRYLDKFQTVDADHLQPGQHEKFTVKRQLRYHLLGGIFLDHPHSHPKSTAGWPLSSQEWGGSTGLVTTLKWVPTVPRSGEFCEDEIIHRKSLSQGRVRENGHYTIVKPSGHMHPHNSNLLNVWKVTGYRLLSSHRALIPLFHRLRTSQYNIIHNWMADPLTAPRWGFLWVSYFLFLLLLPVYFSHCYNSLFVSFTTPVYSWTKPP